MDESGKRDEAPGAGKWYELFSRGARDWLRHDEKVREAVRASLPEIIAGGDVINEGARTVRVPVRMLEHYHFRLRNPEEQQGAGQGKAKPGDVFSDPSKDKGPGQKGGGGRDDGGVQLLLEFKVDDIVDWLWEEMQLPNLKARSGPAAESDWVREGWDRRGARSRLDRRRSFKEFVKRRGTAGATPSLTDDDLRFRQLTRRKQPAVHAVVFFMLDVSGSMSDRDRKLAKTFFFWVVQGLRRQYRSLETVFVAHTTEAWEFNEPDFFQVSGSGGTVASAGFLKVREIMDARFNPAPQQHLPLLCVRRRQRGERCRGRAQRAGSDRRRHLLHRLRGGLLRGVAAARHRNRPAVCRAHRRRLRRRQLRAQRLR